jgi:hypothetical protein
MGSNEKNIFTLMASWFEGVDGIRTHDGVPIDTLLLARKNPSTAWTPRPKESVVYGFSLTLFTE